MDFSRQKTLFNPKEQKLKIFIIGAGSTGSFITLTLAKLGFENIKVIDYDKVEEHNIPNQFYTLKDVGVLKTTALKEMVKNFTGTQIEIENVKINDTYEFDLELDSLIILCVDNMKARKIVYEKIKDFPIKLIDTRMGGEGYQIYTINLENDDEKKEYEKRLKMRTKDAPCGEKATIFTVLSIASETCQIVKNIDKEEPFPKTLKREMNNYHFLTDLK